MLVIAEGSKHDAAGPRSASQTPQMNARSRTAWRRQTLTPDQTERKQNRRIAASNAHQLAVLAGLAIATTLFTTSLTHFLLSRPWCIKTHASGEQTIVYGSKHCVEPSLPQPPLQLISQRIAIPLAVFKNRR